VSLFSEEKFYSSERFQLSQTFAYPERFGPKMPKLKAFLRVKKIKKKEEKIIKGISSFYINSIYKNFECMLLFRLLI